MADVQNGARISRDVVIASGAQTSDVVTLGPALLVAVTCPAMTSTVVTIQVSTDGINFYTPLFQNAALSTLAVTVSTTEHIVDIQKYAAYKWFRLTCGSAEGSARTLTLHGYIDKSFS